MYKCSMYRESQKTYKCVIFFHIHHLTPEILVLTFPPSVTVGKVAAEEQAVGRGSRSAHLLLLLHLLLPACTLCHLPHAACPSSNACTHVICAPASSDPPCSLCPPLLITIIALAPNVQSSTAKLLTSICCGRISGPETSELLSPP